MKRPLSVLVAAVMAVSGTALSFTPAQAGMMPRIAPAAMSQAAPAADVVEVGHRRWHRGNRGWRGNNRHYRQHRRYAPRYRYHRRYDNDGGAAAAAGIIGFAAGAIIGSQVNGGYSSHSACAARYRSYDPASGTYLGYDGYRHRCYP